MHGGDRSAAVHGMRQSGRAEQSVSETRVRASPGFESWVSQCSGMEAQAMAFELLLEKAGSRTDALPAGKVSVIKSGNVAFNIEDLRKAGINDEVFVAVDKSNRRIGIRKPSEDEAAAVWKLKGKGCSRRTSLRQAFRAIGLNVDSCVGRYDVVVHQGMVSFSPEVTIGKPARKK